jgi:hypothetical protein
MRRLRAWRAQLDAVERSIRHVESPNDWNPIYIRGLAHTNDVLRLLRHGRVEQAWYVLNQWKGRQFLHEMFDAQWALVTEQAVPGRLALAAQYDRLRIEHQTGWSDHHAARRSDLNEPDVKGISARTDDLWAQMGVISRILMAETERIRPSVAWQPAEIVSTPTVKEFQSLLRPDEVYLDIVWGSDGAALFQVQRSGIAAHPVGSAVERRWENDLARAERLRKSGSPWQLDSDLGNEIFGQLFRPDQLVLLSPHERFAHHAQFPPHLYFPLTTPVGVVPGATFLAHRRRKLPGPRTFGGDYLGVADQDGGSLAGPAAETGWIHDRYFPDDPPPVLNPRNASELMPAREVRLLHIASHAQPGGLRLGGRWITQSDVYSWGVRAEIVLLTGCSLGLGDGLISVNDFSDIVKTIVGVTGAAAAIVSVDTVPDSNSLLFVDLLAAALRGRAPALEWGGCGTPPGPLCAGEALAWARSRLAGITKNELDQDRSGLVASATRLAQGARVAATQIVDPTWLRSWCVIGDPRATLTNEPTNRSLAIPALTSTAGQPSRNADAPDIRKAILSDGAAVDYYNSEQFRGGELGAMDVIEATKAPSILRTEEGAFRCWIDGVPVDMTSSLETAKRSMLRLLHPEAEPQDLAASIFQYPDPVFSFVRQAKGKNELDLARTSLGLTQEQVRSANSTAGFFTEESGGRRWWSADVLFPMSLLVPLGDPFYDMNRLNDLHLDFGGNPARLIVRCNHLRVDARHDSVAADFIWGQRDYGRYLDQSGVRVTGTHLIGPEQSQFEVQECRWDNGFGVPRQGLCWLRDNEAFWEVVFGVSDERLSPLLASIRWLDDTYFRNLAIAPRILDGRREEDLRAIAAEMSWSAMTDVILGPPKP